MNHWSCQVVEPVEKPATIELQFSKNFNNMVDDVCSDALKEHPRKQTMVLRDVLFRAIPISFDDARTGGTAMGNIMLVWDILNHQEYDRIPAWFVRNDRAPFSHPPVGSPMESYLLARGFYSIRQLMYQVHLAKRRYESIKSATKNPITGEWRMVEGLSRELNIQAATLTCFLFPFLKPTVAKAMWDKCYLWYKSFNFDKMGFLLNEWNRMYDILNQDSVKIVLKACHGWIGEPGSLFTNMTKEEKEGRFSPISKKNHMTDTTLMFVDLICHPPATYTRRQVKAWEPPEVVTLAERVARDDVTATYTAVDSGGHTYYMTRS